MDFYVEQTAKVQQKIDFVLKLVQTVDRVLEKFLKHLCETDGLYEIRVEWGVISLGYSAALTKVT